MTERRNRVTLQTIADRMGVSRATVSYAFSRPDQLSEELRRRILDVARELGYAGPNPAARSLRLGRARALGLIFTETLPYAFADPYAIGFLQGLAAAAEEAEVGLLILPQPRGVERADIVGDAVVDGFCVYSLPDGHAALKAVLARRLPTVVVDEPYLPDHPFVGVDEVAAGSDAARHVLELGHRRLAVAVVGLHHDGRSGWADVARQEGAVFEAMRKRVGGYRAACEAAGLAWGEVPVYELARNTRGGGREAGHKLLALDPRPTAILCNTDILALGVLDAAADLGLEVPGELSVVGFSDSGAEEAGLTSIHQPKHQIGETAGRLLLSKTPPKPRSVIFPHRLVVRRTTGPAPRTA
ncbi:LacI family DNA-binding transcriptional regulator [Thermoactinospora rubra]|uniref:LacI family DNA-binding transcriptional regulator n=1 Tax=Thermoactinospora rubra TaxID=1088767 RepID=UPI000A10AF87|nr:LacI family DNA-binding transcriptional regulator [Thermoactinospora rubra]